MNLEPEQARGEVSYCEITRKSSLSRRDPSTVVRWAYTTREDSLRVGSLFSGIGGFDLGLERAGHTIAWQCEADEWRRSVLRAHWPGVPAHDDVGTFAGGDGLRGVGGSPAAVEGWERSPATVDMVCGGFPCQDLSVAGRRAGLAGERSGLFHEFARVADVVLPAGGWILVENVPGLLSSQRGRDFAVVLATLADLGFHDLAWRVLDSRHFGVAQRRRRVYILARRARGQRACTVLLEPESSGWDLAQGGEAGQGVAVASLSGLGSGGADDNDGLPAQGVRRLTPMEAERLQGFPDGWTAYGPDSRRYAALGDAVTVNVAEWIGRRIMASAL